MELKPFWSYFGGKWRKAPLYPKPAHSIIIEPFAGAAGYSLRYPKCEIILVEKDPVIARLWKWLILASQKQILSLPVLLPGERVSQLDLPPEAKTLIGFWLGKGFESPRDRISLERAMSIARSSWWGDEIKQRIANQISWIKHWQVIEGDYEAAPDIDATWFIDPPYQKAGIVYKQSAKAINFNRLADWCKSRKGQVLVCENEGADWLPFTHLYTHTGQSNKPSGEVLYQQGG